MRQQNALKVVMDTMSSSMSRSGPLSSEIQLAVLIVLYGLARDPQTRYTIGKYDPLMIELRVISDAAVKFGDQKNRPLRVLGDFLQDLFDSQDFSAKRELIIQNTPITFYEDEILFMISNHLAEKQLSKTASALVDEAGKCNYDVKCTPHLPDSSLSILKLKERKGGFGSSNEELKSHDFVLETPNPMKLPQFGHQNERAPRKVSNYEIKKCPSILNKCSTDDAPCLSDIVGQYFRNQHSRCTHPVAYLPPFSLATPHVCSTPQNRSHTLSSFISSRSMGATIAGSFGLQMQKATFSKFSTARSHRDAALRCSEFSKYDSSKLWVVGSITPHLAIYQWDFETGSKREILRYQNTISTLSIHDDSLLLTNGLKSYDDSEAILWKVLPDAPANKCHTFPIGFRGASLNSSGTSIGGVKHSKSLGQYKTVVGLYDSATLILVSQYTIEVPQAMAECFSPFAFGHGVASNLICASRCLFDIRSDKMIHSFDYLTEKANCCFHPDGNTLAISNQIWDLRYSKSLLHSLLDMSSYVPRFSADGTILYGYFDFLETSPHLFLNSKAKFFGVPNFDSISVNFDGDDGHTVHAALDSQSLAVSLIKSPTMEGNLISVHSARKYPGITDDDSDEEWAEENEEWNSDSDDEEMEYEEDLDDYDYDHDFFDQFEDEEEDESEEMYW